MRERWIATVALGCVLALAACGSQEAAAPPADSGMDMEAAMDMGDATLPRADEIAGADLVSGRFIVLESAPVGYDGTRGTAWLARHAAGTTVTVELSGLLPNSPHIAHVHSGSCAEAGGPHYQFDPDGGTMPPNEIHLLFTSDANGGGLMTAESVQVAGAEARSVVVHPTNAMDAKVSCAELG